MLIQFTIYWMVMYTNDSMEWHGKTKLGHVIPSDKSSCSSFEDHMQLSCATVVTTELNVFDTF